MGINRRKIEENIFKALMVSATFIIFFTLALILVTVVLKGLPALNLAMITQIPKGGFYLGKEGGILNAIVGSLYLTAGATLLAILVSLPVVLYLNVYARKGSGLINFTRFSLDVLWGVPSIVYGAFGFTLMLLFGLKTSLLAGIITVALLIFPIMSRAMDEVIRMVPEEIFEASYALGATRLETALKVITRQALDRLVEHYLKVSNLWDEVKDRLNTPAARLSLGQQQRLCLARGLAVEPEIILGDEPTSALDPKSSQHIEQNFLAIKDQYTIIVVTHILRQAKRIADYVIFVYFGELIEHGPAGEIFENPKEEITKEYIKGVIS